MRVLTDPGTADHFIHDTLILRFLHLVHGIAGNAQMQNRFMRNQIDLVYIDPQLHPVMIPVQNHLTVAFKTIDCFFLIPSPVFQDQIDRHFIMAHGDHRFHSVGKNLIDQVIVKSQPFLIGFSIVAIGENPRPVDRCAVRFQT